MTRRNYNKLFIKESKTPDETIQVGQGGFAKILNDESSEKKSEEIKIELPKQDEDIRLEIESPKCHLGSANLQKSNFTEKQVTKCGFLNIRETPDTNAKIIGMIKRDAIVHVLVNDGEWSKILVPGNRTECYVKSKFLTLRKAF